MTEMTSDLIKNALDQDFNKANDIFGEIMGTKVNDMLDQEKIRLSDQIYNGIEPEQMELPLEGGDGDEDSEEAQVADEVDEAEPDMEGEVPETVQEPSGDVEEPVGDEESEQDEDDD